MKRILTVSSIPRGVSVHWLRTLDALLKRRFHITKAISVAFIDAARMRKLNRVYRRVDAPTDVLSFRFAEDGRADYLGELLICPSIVRAHARKQRNSFEHELQHVMVHGVLHLVGFGHSNKRDTRIMELAEQDLLTRLRKA